LAEVYGAGSHEGLEALAATVRRFPLVPYPSGAARLAPLWIDDAVDAVVQALTRPHLREDRYTIAGPRTYTLEAIIELLAAGLAVRRIGVPLAAVLFRMASRMPLPGGGRVVRYDQIARLQCPKDSDIAAARRDLGFAPVDFEHGVARLLAGVRERH
jgi:nucleoside-diphosphate-sugar epimerase